MTIDESKNEILKMFDQGLRHHKRQAWIKLMVLNKAISVEDSRLLTEFSYTIDKADETILDDIIKRI